MRINIRMAIDLPQGGSPHQRVTAALKALTRSVESSSEDEPALGGELQDASGARLGSYVVEFN